jgi:transposase
MKTMDDYVRVRQMHEIEGLSLREISRQTGMHRDTIKKIIEEGAPPGYRRRQLPKRPVLGPFTAKIDQILKADKNAPRKQRHTARRIWERLREEYGYQGGYTQVCEYVRQACERDREAYVPLAFEPGTAQVDWGEARVWDEGHWRKVHLFVMTLPLSGARFVAVFPRPTLEFFLEGHRRAFVFFQGVPRLIIYDNLKSAVVKVKRHHNRILNKSFKRFTQHHLFEARFCNVGRGNEKGHVENGVKWAQKKLFVPVPRFTDWTRFNEQMAEACRRHFDHTPQEQEQSVGQLFKTDQIALLSIPKRPAPLGKKDSWSISSLCLVRFDHNDYSVPCEFAHGRAVVQADVAQVRIFATEVIHEKAPLIAVHTRCHRRGKTIYEPIHYLPLVERKSRTLDDGAPMKQLRADLPECFEVLRRRLELARSDGAGTREFIAVLRLLEDHSIPKLTRAVERALELGVEHPEAIKNLLMCPPEATPSPLDLSGRDHLAGYGVAPPPLANYGALAGRGGVS